MAYFSRERCRTVFWLAAAAGALGVAALASPDRVLLNLDGRAAHLRDSLVQGITLVRLALLGAAALALASWSWWRAQPQNEVAGARPRAADLLAALGLFLLSILLAMPN